MKRSILVTWLIGWMAYMQILVLSTTDGVPAMFFTPFIAAIVSFVSLAVAAPVGWLLTLLPCFHHRRFSALASLVFAGTGFVFIGYSGTPELSTYYFDFEASEGYRLLDPRLAITGFAACMLGGYFYPIAQAATKPVEPGPALFRPT